MIAIRIIHIPNIQMSKLYLYIFGSNTCFRITNKYELRYFTLDSYLIFVSEYNITNNLSHLKSGG